MKRYALSLLVSLVLASFTLIDSAVAQVCAGGFVGVGPIGVGVVVDCPPPPPPVVVVRPRRVVRHVVVEQPVVVQQQQARPLPPPPPAITASRGIMAPRWTLGAMMDSSSYSDGGMVGGGVYARFLLNDQLAVEGHISGQDSCTNCNSLAHRNDARAGIAGLYFLNPVQADGLNLYLKGGVTSNQITYINDYNGDSMSTSQVNFEAGGGIEWRLAPWLSLNVEVTAMSAISGEEIGRGSLDDHIGNGIPASDLGNGAVNFRMGIAAHF